MAIGRGQRVVEGFKAALRSLATVEKLEELPEELPGRGAAPKERGVGSWLFELEPLEEEPVPPEPQGAARRSLLSRLLWLEELPLDPVPPASSRPAGAGWFRTLFGLEELGVEPEERRPRAATPLLKWLLWPESLEEHPPTRREK